MITLGLKQRTGTPSKRSRPKLELFLSLCQHIATFMAKHVGGSSKAYISHEGGGSLCLYLMTEAEAYDFELSAKLADFAGPYIERGLLDSVMLLPASSAEELAVYFDPDSAVRVEIDHA